MTTLPLQRPRPGIERELIPAHGYVCDNGHISAPWCCAQRMIDDGNCAWGHNDDYRCKKCGRRVRIPLTD